MPGGAPVPARRILLIVLVLVLVLVLVVVAVSCDLGEGVAASGVLAIPAVWERWWTDLERASLRPRTIDAYRCIFWAWAGFCDDRGRRWDRATPRDVEAFVRRHPIAANTAKHYTSGVRELYRFAARAGILRTDRMAALVVPRGGEPEARALSLDEMEHLFDCLEDEGWWRQAAEDGVLGASQANRQRVRLVIWLAYWAALRAGEIARARREDVRLRAGVLMVPQGKGGRAGKVPLAQPLALLLRAELDGPGRGVGPLVEHLRYSGTHVRPSWVSALGSRAMHAAGISESLHALRHTSATMMLEADPTGANLLAVSDVLRHSSIVVTRSTYTVGADVGAARAVALLAKVADPRRRQPLGGEVPGGDAHVRAAE
jgi:integrase